MEKTAEAVEAVGEADSAIKEVATPAKDDGDDKDQYKTDTEEKVTLGHYFRIFSYSTRGDKIAIAIGLIASAGAGVTLPVMNIVFGNLVGTFNNFFTPGSSSTADAFTDSINRLTLYLVYIWIGKFVLCYIFMVCFRIVSIRISAAIRREFLRALFEQPISVLDKLPPGSAANTITGQANLLQIGISEKVALLVQAISLLISSFTIAFVYSWQLTLATSSLLLFVIVVYSAIVPFSVRVHKSKQFADDKASAISSEVFSSIRMVTACGAEDRVSKRFEGWVEEARRRGLKLGFATGIQISPFFFAFFADFGLTFWFGLKLYREGHIDDVSNVLIVLMSVLISVTSLNQVVPPFMAMTKAATAASSFFTVLDAPRLGLSGIKEPDVTASADINFEDVVFAYPSRQHVKVLDGMNVTFEQGKLTAIVGPSGSGKSTVVGLIERWYELSSEAERSGSSASSESPESEKKAELVKAEDTDSQEPPIALSGKVTIGGQDIRGLDMKWWRSKIGLVQQEPFIFNDTIYNNVAHGLHGSPFENESEEVKRELVVEACKEAFADEFISRLPQQYDTQVGESGLKLSGGQRQRLAIARVVIKRPQILIFDEATSAIDVRGERKVQEALDRVSKNRTTITIAHRLSTIKRADKIVVVSKGKVVEQGTHDELIAREQVYHGLVFAQNLNMQEPEPADDEADHLPGLAMEKTISAVATNDKDDIEMGQQPGYQPRGVIRSFGLLLVEQKQHIPWLYLTILGTFGAAAAPPIQAYLMAQAVTVFQNLSDEALKAGAAYWSVRFVYLAIGVGAGYYIMGHASNSFSQHVSCTYRQEYFDSITRQKIEFFDNDEHSTGTLVSRVSTDPTQLQEMMGINLGFAMISFWTIIGCIIISFVYGWKLTLVAVFSAMPIILAASYYRLRFEIQFEKLNAAVFAESSKFAAEAIGAFRTVTSLTLEDVICGRYSKLLQDHVVAATKKARWSAIIFALSDSINLLCMALTFYYGGQLMADREYDPLMFLVIYIAIIQGTEGAGAWMSLGPNFAQAVGAANRILSFRVSNKEVKATQSLPSSSEKGAAIELNHIHFKYPTREIPIFRGLSLSIPAGKFAALVGPSGCGKTSIVSLLEQFYTVQRGSITFDGVDIRDLDLAEYRRHFSLVAQEATLFQGTIKENILLGVDDVTEEQMFDACRAAEIHNFISSLPDGYKTDIGSRGVALSGGQKQRIAIARALIRDPRVLLLDEATSSLDSESERLVQAAFEKAGKGRTMVVVAHRLATVQNADIIFVLGDGGRLIESGTHSELVAKRGMYWQMCQSQALDR